jgi:hypothetical protein
MTAMEVAAALPRIDEHEISVDVPAEEAWLAVLDVFERLTARPIWRAIARVVRCNPDRASGDPVIVGATVPGFRVTHSLSPNEWALEGRHRGTRSRFESLWLMTSIAGSEPNHPPSFRATTERPIAP